MMVMSWICTDFDHDCGNDGGDDNNNLGLGLWSVG